MSSNKKNKVEEVPTIEEEVTVSPVVAEEAPVETVNPIDAKIALLTVEQQAEIAQFKSLLSMFTSKKVLAEPFKVFCVNTDLYETSTNQAEVDKLQASIDSAKNALKAAGF